MWFSEVESKVILGEEMSEPGFKGFKYWFEGDAVDYTMSSETDVEIKRDGTREHVPAEVVGGSIGSD